MWVPCAQFSFEKNETQMVGTYSRASTDGAETSESNIQMDKIDKVEKPPFIKLATENGLLGISQSFFLKIGGHCQVPDQKRCPLIVR